LWEAAFDGDSDIVEELLKVKNIDVCKGPDRIKPIDIARRKRGPATTSKVFGTGNYSEIVDMLRDRSKGCQAANGGKKSGGRKFSKRKFNKTNNRNNKTTKRRLSKTAKRLNKTKGRV
jgi:hypothetical protein